ncbi:MAG: type II toxin-antitoxin system YafQ family toxin [Pseudomonadota bacterium]|nr:type II toxin-antitoxin system YafQ family toxin [Pseudomonadota bacterium]
MRTPVHTGQFRRDTRRAQRRGKDMSKLRDVLSLLIAAEPHPPRLNDHPLTGDWSSYRDCHIEPDWLLLYKIDGNDLILARTGTHADLFR